MILPGTLGVSPEKGDSPLDPDLTAKPNSFCEKKKKAEARYFLFL
jgi:hypothetical protein